MKPSEIAREAKRLITNPANWCKGCPARNILGMWEPVSSDLAVSFCMAGSLVRVGYKHQHSLEIVSSTLSSIVQPDIGKYNDASTHETVIQKFDELITILEQKEANERA